MKNTLLMYLFFLITTYSIAQIPVPKQEQINQFLKTTTCVVFDANPMVTYNITIKEAVEKYWKITPYKFIKASEYDKLRKNPACSFLTIDKVFFEKDKTKAQYEFLCVSLGGKYRTQNDMPQIATIPLAYYGVDEESYVYKIPALIQFLQNHINLIKEKPSLKGSNILKYYNSQIEKTHNKTLYLIKDELSTAINTEQKIKSVYPYPFVLTDRNILENKIMNGDDILFLHKVGPEGSKRKARCWIIIMGAKDVKLYYFNYHMIDAKHPDGILLTDFKKLSKK